MKTFSLQGLSHEEASRLMKEGKGNVLSATGEKSTKEVVFSHIFTPFNLLNTVLALVIIAVSIGYPEHLKNLLFMGIIVSNTFIGLFQELRARKAVSRLSLLTDPKVKVIRDGKEESIRTEELVEGDVFHLTQGDQIPVDARICSLMSSYLEVDESLLTGEPDAIRKTEEDEISSGCFVVSGEAYARAIRVGDETEAAKITKHAKAIRASRSEIMRSLNHIVKRLSVAILFVGTALLVSKLLRNGGEDIRSVLVSTVGALIGMIPEGLVLLTSVAFALSVVKLSGSKILVHEMSSVETLARLDTLCLDKTGTITSGRMKVVAFHAEDGTDEGETLRIVGSAFRALNDKNATAKAIREFAEDGGAEFSECIPFSSERKWSAVVQGNTTWVFGAAEFILPKSELAEAEEKIRLLASKGRRVLAVARGEGRPEGETLPPSVCLVGLFEIQDELRQNAAETFEYFHKQGVDLKIISGDSVKTVRAIASQAGIQNLGKSIDLSSIPDDEPISHLAEEYQLFGRVKPFRKMELVEALQAGGHTVGMTGDGVNDVPALKKADCSIAMAEGSDAARLSADLVLTENDLSAMIGAVYEGRRVINNIERVATLFLNKTVYTTLLAFLFIFLRARFPLYPIQFTLIGTLTIGMPAFVLALRPNKDRVTGEFLPKVLSKAIPAGISIALLMVLHQIGMHVFGWPEDYRSTISVLLLSAAGMAVLFLSSRPVDLFRGALLSVCLAGLLIAFLFFPRFFFLVPLSPAGGLYALVLVLLLFPLMWGIHRIRDKVSFARLFHKKS